MINHLLLIDDDPIARKVHSFMAQKTCLPKQTTCLSDGQEAVEYLEQVIASGNERFPDLIFLDLQMPRLDGWGFLEVFLFRFAELSPNTKIVIITSTVEASQLMKAYNYPFVLAVLQKPIQLSELEGIRIKCRLQKVEIRANLVGSLSL